MRYVLERSSREGRLAPSLPEVEGIENFKPGLGLFVVRLGAPDQKLIPYKGLKFRIPEFADVIIEFVEEQGQITAMKQIDPSGEYVSKRK